MQFWVRRMTWQKYHTRRRRNGNSETNKTKQNAQIHNHFPVKWRDYQIESLNCSAQSLIHVILRSGSLHTRCAVWKESRGVGASAPVGPDSWTRSGGCRLLTSFGHISVCLPFSLPLGQSPSHPAPSPVPRAPLPESPSDLSVSSHPSTPGRAALTERPGPASIAVAAALEWSGGR